jgi:hypothetical protein
MHVPSNGHDHSYSAQLNHSNSKEYTTHAANTINLSNQYKQSNTHAYTDSQAAQLAVGNCAGISTAPTFRLQALDTS